MKGGGKKRLMHVGRNSGKHCTLSNDVNILKGRLVLGLIGKQRSQPQFLLDKEDVQFAPKPAASLRTITSFSKCVGCISWSKNVSTNLTLTVLTEQRNFIQFIFITCIH